MRTVLGLSLSSTDVVWVLVDKANGAVVDHDVLEFAADAEIAGAAARGAQAIATSAGCHVSRVRLTWSEDAARDGLRLRTRLGSLGFTNVEAVPLSCANAALIAPAAMDMNPHLALAYGAARAEVSLSEAITVPVQQLPARGRRRARRIATAVLGVAAAAAVGGLCLSAGASPRLDPETTTAGHSVSSDPSDTGWAAVPAVPAAPAAAPVRKIVAGPSSDEEAPAPQFDYPVQAVIAEAVQPLPESAAVPQPATEVAPVPLGQPHLTGVDPGVGPVPVAVEAPAEAPAPVPEMTDPLNLFSALP